MPTVKQNIDKWDLDFDWNLYGDEWPDSRGNTENFWWWVVYTRYMFLFDTRFPFISEKTHWRAKSMSADKFFKICEKYKLNCISQELINWGVPFLINCFSTFKKGEANPLNSNKIMKNYDFMSNSALIKKLSSIYS